MAVLMAVMAVFLCLWFLLFSAKAVTIASYTLLEKFSCSVISTVTACGNFRQDNRMEIQITKNYGIPNEIVKELQSSCYPVRKESLE